MTRRHLDLAQIRRELRVRLGDEWRSIPELCDELDVPTGGLHWYRVGIVVERMVTDGEAEIRRPWTTHRRYRRAAKEEADE